MKPARPAGGIIVKTLEWLKGKKTYIVAGVAAVLAFASAMGWDIPEGIILVLTALGLTTARKGASNDAKGA